MGNGIASWSYPQRCGWSECDAQSRRQSVFVDRGKSAAVAGLVAVHLDRSSIGVGTGMFCRNGLASFVIDAVRFEFNDRGSRADEGRPSDRYGRWDTQQRNRSVFWQVALDCRFADRLDGDVAQSNVGVG